MYFNSSSLYGQAGLSIIGDNGVEYTFKYWISFETYREFNYGFKITKSEIFSSVFSDKYDITIIYYCFNNIILMLYNFYFFSAPNKFI